MQEEFATFWEHIDQLRKLILRTLFIVLAGTCLAFFFYREIFAFLALPLQKNPEKYEIKRERIYNSGTHEIVYRLDPQTRLLDGPPGANTFIIPPQKYLDIERIEKTKLVMLSPIEGFVAALKVSFWVGLFLTLPLCFFNILQFIKPALRQAEKRFIFPFVALAYLFLCAGLSFAYFITIPYGNIYLESFNQQIGINSWTVSAYLNYTLTLLLANAFAFESALFLLLLVHFNVISVESLQNKRRHMIVAAFIIGALLTPPDVLTQFLLAIPLIGLYELAILYGKMRAKFTTGLTRHTGLTGPTGN